MVIHFIALFDSHYCRIRRKLETRTIDQREISSCARCRDTFHDDVAANVQAMAGYNSYAIVYDSNTKYALECGIKIICSSLET